MKLHQRARVVGFALVALAALSLASASPCAAQSRASRTSKADEIKAEGLDAARLFAAIVKVSAHAVPDARSSATLGDDREGTGVVIGDNGLILTIGYLIVEADEVSIVDSKGRTLSARVVGYDHATGFALLRTLAPFDAKPVALGESGKAAEHDPVMIASAGEDNVAFAYIVSKRAFSGNWEYALDQALYTSPPMMNWSGAGLFDRDGRLLGVGSLIVREANDDEPKIPGNMFVPIDLLKPILADLVKSGRRAGPARPWLGLATDEVSGRLVVARVSPEGPADRAGIGAGDIILGVGSDSVRTQAEFYRKVWARGGAGTEIPLKILQGVDVKNVPVVSMDRVDYFKRPTTY
ncbi:MAG TPA: S1C family serine protease [Casimicrobiaceae bacterium]|nr:S1C family serine protease [Casimicrobiaceae bacterium]